MIRIAIVEDEVEYRENICNCLNTIQTESGFSFSITTYGDGLRFLTDYHEQFDLVLMDVGLPDLNGMTVAQKLRERDQNVLLIFITSMAQFALKGYSVRALDYIVKPFSYDEFALKMRRAVGEVAKKKNDIFPISTENGKVFLSVSDIAYIEVKGHKLIFHKIDGEKIENKGRFSLTKAEEQFGRDGFIRCNNSYLLNPRYIQKIGKDMVSIADAEIPISRLMRNKFMEQLATYLNAARSV